MENYDHGGGEQIEGTKANRAVHLIFSITKFTTHNHKLQKFQMRNIRTIR